MEMIDGQNWELETGSDAYSSEPPEEIRAVELFPIWKLRANSSWHQVVHGLTHSTVSCALTIYMHTCTSHPIYTSCWCSVPDDMTFCSSGMNQLAMIDWTLNSR